MQKNIEITIRNKLTAEKRSINVYHRLSGSAHIISYNSSIAFPLGTTEEDDYLHISLVSGPGNLCRPCVMELPSWLDFNFSMEGKATIKQLGKTSVIKIPPGPPAWELKITRSSVTSDQLAGNVILSDEWDEEKGKNKEVLK